STLRNIMIYDHSSMNGNTKVVVAQKGIMRMSEDEKFLLVDLEDGYAYDEQAGRNNLGPSKSQQLLRTKFMTYGFRFDLSSFKLARTNEDLFKDNFQMLNLGQLESAIDSFDVELSKRIDESANSGKSYLMTYRESLLSNLNGDTTNMKLVNSNNSEIVYENAIGQARNLKSYFTSIADEVDSRKELKSRFAIEWHRKFTLSIACFILFLIGAPLGAIIRKGGIGLPVVISVAFFLMFHIISITGEKFVREGVLQPVVGMWIASAVLLPVGAILLYKATHESVIFDPDFYFKMLRRFRKSKT
ncbi:MAG: LptF/LptG family permease, partial [Bacteroidota bacterium]